jgi:hypothetical protein
MQDAEVMRLGYSSGAVIYRPKRLLQPKGSQPCEGLLCCATHQPIVAYNSSMLQKSAHR